MFCKNCSTQIPDNTTQCPHCGFVCATCVDKKPDDHLVAALLVTTLCCLPFGIIALLEASKVENAWLIGDKQAAEYHSKEADKWVKIGFWTAIGICLISGICFLIAVLIAAVA